MTRKTLMGSLIGVGMVLTAALPAFAATTDCSNTTTGASSNNICTMLAKKKAMLNVVNSAAVSNNVYTKSNSGKNTQDKNTVVGEMGIVTLDATATGTVGVQANDTKLGLDQSSDCDCGSTGGNSITGYDSHNEVRISNIKKVNLTVSNSAAVTNSVTTKANTGGNSQSMNTVTGGIMTGPATAGSDVTTIVNTNDITIIQ